MMEMAVPDRRKRGRPRRRWMDLAREDLKTLELRRETKSIGSNGEYSCAVATPNRKRLKEESEVLCFFEINRLMVASSMT